MYALATAAGCSTIRTDASGNKYMPRQEVAVLKRIGVDLMLSYFSDWDVEDMDELQCRLEPFSNKQMELINLRLGSFNMDVISSKDMDFVADFYTQLAKCASPYENMDVCMLMMIGLILGLIVDVCLQCPDRAVYQSMNRVGFGCYHGWDVPGLEHRVSVLFTNSKIRISNGGGIWEHSQGSKDNNCEIFWVERGSPLTGDHLLHPMFLNHFVLLTADRQPALTLPSLRIDQPVAQLSSSSSAIPIHTSPSDVGLLTASGPTQGPRWAVRKAAKRVLEKKRKAEIMQKQNESNRLKQISPDVRLLKQEESILAVLKKRPPERPPDESFGPERGEWCV